MEISEAVSPPLHEDVEARLHRVHPGLGKYMRAFADYFSLPLDVTQQQYWLGIERIGVQQAVLACQEWEKAGILPDVRCESDAQLLAMWSSPLFEIMLRDVVNYYPPATVDLRQYLLPPCSSVVEWAFRRIPLPGDVPYWQRVLYLNLPEIYLEPFIAASGRQELVGCDLACGWGRACLSLRNYRDRRVYGCDFGKQSLNLLGKLAKNAGRSGNNIIPTQCDVTHLPFQPDFFDFFLAFDILEHLPSDSLRRLLAEILRCARPGAVVYAEIPLNSYCPAVTHIQDLSLESLKALLAEATCGRKRCNLVYHSRVVPDHFTFRVTSA